MYNYFNALLSFLANKQIRRLRILPGFKLLKLASHFPHGQMLLVYLITHLALQNFLEMQTQEGEQAHML